MLTWLASVWNAIVSAVVAVISLLGSFIQGIAQLFVMLPNAVSLLSYAITMIPPVLAVFATAFISVSIVYLIIGR